MVIAKNLGKTVLLGGVYPRLGLCKDAPADYICEGEGETLPDFLLHGNDNLFRNAMRISDIHALPLPDYDMFTDIPFNRTTLLKGKTLPYYTSRSCPFSCSFCEIQLQPKGVRIRRKVKEDLTRIIDTYHPDSIFIGDELLPYYDVAWRESWRDFRFPFFAYIRADIKPDVLEWLIDRGMILCAFGVESGDETYRNSVLKKGLSDDQIWNTVELLQKNKVDYAPYFLTGTPKETPEIKAKSLKMLHQLGGYPFMWVYEQLSPVQII
jgi:radical SAM superfamily enzyme YgiQ (UPF0313 family)